MLPPIVYETLWLLLHAVFRLVVAVRREWLDAVARVAAHFEPPATPARERELIERVRTELSKLPAHVSVILNAETPDDERTAAKLAQLLRWSEYAGIEHLSFYDYRGK